MNACHTKGGWGYTLVSTRIHLRINITHDTAGVNLPRGIIQSVHIIYIEQQRTIEHVRVANECQPRTIPARVNCKKSINVPFYYWTGFFF